MTTGSYNRNVYHGGDLSSACARYGGQPEDWLDLSTGINPRPYPVPTLEKSSWSRLPAGDRESELLSAARSYYQVPDHLEIIAAPGTQILIQLLPQILPQRTVSILSPTYAEHETCWQRSGATVSHLASLDQLTSNADLLVCVSPNNPTGVVSDPATLLARAKELKARNGVLILDEAFADVTATSILSQDLQDLPILTLKSFGKFFGLAGLRLGFAIGPPNIIQNLKELIGPWAINGPALEIGCKALSDHDWISRTRYQLKQDQQRLHGLLSDNGLVVEGQTGLFTFTRCTSAANLYTHLCTEKILVRPFKQLPDHLRFGHPATEGEWMRLNTALQSFP